MLILIIPVMAISQINMARQKKTDSLLAKLKADSSHIYRFQKVRPYLSIDNRNSFINRQAVNFKGLQAGVILHEKHTLALGLYKMSQNSKRSVKTLDGVKTAERSVSLNYLTFFYQYAVIDKRYFELDIPLEIGIGGYDIKFQDTATGRIYKEIKGGIIPLGIGIQPVVKPLKWVGITFLCGYRFVASHTAVNFNGLYYSIGLTLDIRQIIRDINYRGFKKKRYHSKLRVILKE
ncbi:MAG: hypothetical protein H0W61_08760 [Bacteroidetes bacterium]|nr:hypothetical protein [Bacteroidota bacterium]